MLRNLGQGIDLVTTDITQHCWRLTPNFETFHPKEMPYIHTSSAAINTASAAESSSPPTTPASAPTATTSLAPAVRIPNTPHFPHSGVRVKAIYAWTPEHSTELGLSPGDVIEVFEMNDVGWTLGRCEGSGGYGWFPITYTEDVEEP